MLNLKFDFMYIKAKFCLLILLKTSKKYNSVNGM